MTVLHRAEDGGLYRFGYERLRWIATGNVDGYLEHQIFDGTKFVERNSQEGIDVFNKMMDQALERK